MPFIRDMELLGIESLNENTWSSSKKSLKGYLRKTSLETKFVGSGRADDSDHAYQWIEMFMNPAFSYGLLLLELDTFDAVNWIALTNTSLTYKNTTQTLNFEMIKGTELNTRVAQNPISTWYHWIVNEDFNVAVWGGGGASIAVNQMSAGLSNYQIGYKHWVQEDGSILSNTYDTRGVIYGTSLAPNTLICYEFAFANYDIEMEFSPSALTDWLGVSIVARYGSSIHGGAAGDLISDCYEVTVEYDPAGYQYVTISKFIGTTEYILRKYAIDTLDKYASDGTTVLWHRLRATFEDRFINVWVNDICLTKEPLEDTEFDVGGFGIKMTSNGPYYYVSDFRVKPLTIPRSVHPVGNIHQSHCPHLSSAFGRLEYENGRNQFTSDPVTHWDMDEDDVLYLQPLGEMISSTAAINELRNHVTGIKTSVQGSPVLSSDVPNNHFKYSIDFNNDGSAGDRIYTGDINILNVNNQGTVEIIFKLHDLSNSYIRSVLYVQDNATHCLYIYFDITNNNLSFYTNNGSSFTGITYPVSNISFGWHQLICTWGGITREMWLDGTLIANDSNPPFKADSSQAGRIGGETGTYPFHGKIAKVRISRRQYTAAECEEQYYRYLYGYYNYGHEVKVWEDQFSLHQDRLICWLPMRNCEAEDNNAIDGGNGRKYNFTANHAPTIENGLPKFGYCRVSDGTNDNFSNTGLLATVPKNWTMSIWYRRDAATAASEYLISTINNAAADLFDLYFDHATQTLVFAYEYNNGGYTTALTSSTGFMVNSIWHHILLVFDNDNSTWYMYIDGNLDDSYTAITNNVMLDGTPAAFRILSTAAGATPTEGAVQDFRVYDCAFTAAEVLKLYNNGMELYNKRDLTRVYSINHDWTDGLPIISNGLVRMSIRPNIINTNLEWVPLVEIYSEGEWHGTNTLEAFPLLSAFVTPNSGANPDYEIQCSEWFFEEITPDRVMISMMHEYNTTELDEEDHLRAKVSFIIRSGVPAIELRIGGIRDNRYSIHDNLYAKYIGYTYPGGQYYMSGCKNDQTNDQQMITRRSGDSYNILGETEIPFTGVFNSFQDDTVSNVLYHIPIIYGLFAGNNDQSQIQSYGSPNYHQLLSFYGINTSYGKEDYEDGYSQGFIFCPIDISALKIYGDDMTGEPGNTGPAAGSISSDDGQGAYPRLTGAGHVATATFTFPEPGVYRVGFRVYGNAVAHLYTIYRDDMVSTRSEKTLLTTGSWTTVWGDVVVRRGEENTAIAVTIKKTTVLAGNLDVDLAYAIPMYNQAWFLGDSADSLLANNYIERSVRIE